MQMSSRAWIGRLVVLALACPSVWGQESADEVPAETAAPTRPRFLPSRSIVRPADTNLDKQIDADEWAAYLKLLRPSDAGEINPVRLRARALVPLLDQDADAELTMDDIFLVFEALDGNVDLTIGAKEFPSNRGPANGGAPQADNTLALACVVMGAADANDDGTVGGDEWGAFIDELEFGRGDALSPDMLVRWIDDTIEKRPRGRAMFAPGVTLRWVSNGVDADGSGVLDLEDMAIFFGELDKDADGVVSSDELAFSFGRGASSRENDLAPLMPWQRNLDDALALVRSTGKPLLICVNSQGEFASDSLALRRYRDPVFVDLVRGFIPLLVSPDRRNPRDYDDRGRRIVDPRFGRVTNAEHIGVEAVLFKRYFDGERVAPRHLAVDASGKVLFDIFLASSLAVVDTALREHGHTGVALSDPATMTEAQLLASPDALHREYIESAFDGGDVLVRTRLASLALSSARSTQHPELLRLALADSDARVTTQAAWTIARHPAHASLRAFRSALRIAASDSNVTAALLAGLRDVAYAKRTGSGERSRDARNLLYAFEGMRSRSDSVDIEGWRVALSWSDHAAPQEPLSADALARQLAVLDERMARYPNDRESILAFAATALRFAELRIRKGGDPTFLLGDTVAAATRVAAAGGLGSSDYTGEVRELDGRALALAARAHYLLGDMGQAGDDAAGAVRACIPWAGSRSAAMALEVLYQVRVRSINKAMKGGAEWPASWVADAIAAGTVLLEHPLGDERMAVSLLGFLRATDLAGTRSDLTHKALARYPASTALNGFLRIQVLADEGAAALQASYARLEVTSDYSTSTRWFSALAQLSAAERFVQNGNEAQALDAYRASVERFRSSGDANDGSGPPAAHYLCLALAGAARVQADQKEWGAAIDSLKAGVAAKPASVWEADGLGNTPRETARRLHSSLVEAGLVDKADGLREAMAKNGLSLE